MKLYYNPGACSLASHIVLNESGLSYTTQAVDLKTHQTDGKDFRSINPKGYVPVLELDSGEFLTEGAAILQFIADHAPGKNLAPKNGTMERYRCQEWLNYIATEVHKSFSALWNRQNPETVLQAARDNLGRKFDFLSKHLSGRAYLMGDQYTVADAYLFTVLNWCRPLKLDLSKWPALVKYVETVGARPATAAAMRAEGILK